jgi:spore maturation protein CgeB
MRLLLVGADKVFSIENFYVRHFKESGVEVKHFTAPNTFNDYHQKSFLNRILFRAGLSSIYRRINNQLKSVVTEFNPQVVWIFKGMEIFPESLEWIRSKNILLANYNPDNPFIFSGRGSGNSNITRSIRLYDLHFTYNVAIMGRLRAEFRLRTALLPFGFEMTDQVFNDCSAMPEIKNACFLGNPDIKRAEFILALAARSIPIHVYGNHWRRYISHPNVIIHEPVHGLGVWEVLRRYRVSLNLMRVHNMDSHNMRSFEIPGIGGIMVAPDTSEHRMFFEHGKEAFLFADVEACARIIKMLLEMDTTDADRIRESARSRSLNSGYRYIDRAGLALKELQSLL